MTKVNCWWMRGPKPGNLGDIITPFILRKLGFEPFWVNPNTPNKLVCVGSVAKSVTIGDVAWGCGILDARNLLEKNATWLAVRGPLTGEKVGCKVYGDPGLLCSNLFPMKTKSEGTAAIPHYIDSLTLT